MPILRGFLAFFALFFSIVFFYFLLDTKKPLRNLKVIIGGGLRHPPYVFNDQ
jgi:hypothetical protein